MRIKITAVVLLLGCAAACGQVTPGAPVAPAPPPATATTTTAPDRPATSRPPTTTKPPPPTTKRSTTSTTTTTRIPPTAGYQCRDGDEKLYEVCAGHKAWVDGQVEYANCLDGGGTWNVALQRCDYPHGTTSTRR